MLKKQRGRLLKKEQNWRETRLQRRKAFPMWWWSKRSWSNPLGLTIRVNSSAHWGRRRAPGTLYHYWRGWRTPTHRRGPVWITCCDQIICLLKENKRLEINNNRMENREVFVPVEHFEKTNGNIQGLSLVVSTKLGKEKKNTQGFLQKTQ